MTDITITPPEVITVTATSPTAYTITVTQPAAVTVTATSESHLPVTIGTANGLSLATQTLSLGLASAGVTGALSGTDWSTFNAKEPAITILQTSKGGTGVNNSFNLTISGTSTINGSLVGSMTGGGTVATGGFTLTVPEALIVAGRNVSNTFLQTQYISTSATGYVDSLEVSNTGDPGAGSTGVKISNTVSALYLRSYGSTAPGILAGAASLGAEGTSFILGGGLLASTYIYSNNRYLTPEISINYSTAYVGINTTAPLARFNVCFPDGAVATDLKARGILSEYYGAGASAKGITAIVAGGTKASPTAVAANNNIFLAVPVYYDGTVYRFGATIGSYVTAATNNTSVSSELRFFSGVVTGNAASGATTGIAERLRIDPTGLITVGSAGGGTGRFQITGSTDIIQSRTLAHSTQTTNIATWESSAAAVYVAISGTGVFFPRQTTTAAAPAYVKGGMYFDTTLNKLRIGGATAWETVTSV